MEQLNCAIKNCTVLYLNQIQFFFPILHSFSIIFPRLYIIDFALTSPTGYCHQRGRISEKVGVESSTPFKTTNCAIGLGGP